MWEDGAQTRTSPGPTCHPRLCALSPVVAPVSRCAHMAHFTRHKYRFAIHLLGRTPLPFPHKSSNLNGQDDVFSSHSTILTPFLQGIHTPLHLQHTSCFELNDVCSSTAWQLENEDFKQSFKHIRRYFPFIFKMCFHHTQKAERAPPSSGSYPKCSPTSSY